MPRSVYEELKIFLQDYSEHSDPTGPTWTLTRFCGQAILEKIQREKIKKDTND